VAHPISADFRREMEAKIIAEYNAGHIEKDIARDDGER
jgi:DNA-binding cell septation regulator SpoVG